MSNNNFMNQERHNSLVFRCALYEFYYNRTFEGRVSMDLGIICVSRDSYPKELRVLSDEELENRIKNIQIPWWNDIYDDIKNDRKILEILWERGCNLQDIEKLHELWKKGDIEKINSIYTTTIRRSKFLSIFNFRWIHLLLDYISPRKNKL